jgi:hypothetical protein
MFWVDALPVEVAGRMFRVHIDDGPVPAAVCFDPDVAERVAELLTRHGLVDGEVMP